MLVVPIAGDTITIDDGSELTVQSYTNYKDSGPAVYAKAAGSDDLVPIYFSDIDTINGTEVEYKKSSKVFQAFGKIQRPQQLPQPDDTVILMDDTQVEVADLRLKSKSIGESKGMVVKSTTDSYARIRNIKQINRSIGDDSFDREQFLSTYHDYLGSK